MNAKLDCFLRLPAVEAITGLKRTKIKEMIAAGVFPRPVALSDGGRAIAWPESELLTWQQSRLAKRSGGAK